MQLISQSAILWSSLRLPTAICAVELPRHLSLVYIPLLSPNALECKIYCIYTFTHICIYILRTPESPCACRKPTVQFVLVFANILHSESARAGVWSVLWPSPVSPVFVLRLCFSCRLICGVNTSHSRGVFETTVTGRPQSCVRKLGTLKYGQKKWSVGGDGRSERDRSGLAHPTLCGYGMQNPLLCVVELR